MLEESEAAADVSGEVDGGYLAEIGVGLAEGVGVRGEVEGKMEGGEACLPVEESAEELWDVWARGGVLGSEPGTRGPVADISRTVSQGFGRRLFILWLFLVSTELLQG